MSLLISLALATSLAEPDIFVLHRKRTLWVHTKLLALLCTHHDCKRMVGLFEANRTPGGKELFSLSLCKFRVADAVSLLLL